MALNGTLKDFGIAEILQLIGQQQKSGTLVLKEGHQEVHVGFKDGAIVKAETSTRKKQDLIGAMLVRARLISEEQLEAALETQKKTEVRLGEVLAQAGVIAEKRFKELVKLQATETVFGLFQWKSGTYQFEQGEVEFDLESMTPLRAEGVLMDGMRMVDEWPMLRKKLSNYATTFAALKALPQEVEQKEDVDLDDAFGEFKEEKKAENKGEFQSIGRNERLVYSLLGPNVDTQTLIDRACLGEFETVKALVNLLNLGYVSAFAPSAAASRKARKASGKKSPAVELALRLALPLGVLVVLVGLGSVFLASPMNALTSTATYSDPAAQRFIGEQQLARLGEALELYRLEKGELPKSLDSLVESGLVEAADLMYPWKERYHYRAGAEGRFILLPPLR